MGWPKARRKKELSMVSPELPGTGGTGPELEPFFAQECARLSELTA